MFKILELIETNANNKSFRAYVMKTKENAYFRTIAMYFRTIGNYAFSAGLKEIKDKWGLVLTSATLLRDLTQYPNKCYEFTWLNFLELVL